MKTTTAVEKDERAKNQARTQFDSIKEMIQTLENEDSERDEARIAIEEDPLSIQIRSGWRSIGEKLEPEEFEILLCTGGPAVRIIGELDEHGQPYSPKLQYQDWFTQWEDYPLESEEEEILSSYCNVFYFGE